MRHLYGNRNHLFEIIFVQRPIVTMEDNLCGLYHKDKELVVRGIKAQVDILNVVAKVSVSIRIRNDQDHPLEVVFKFRQSNCSVHNFEATIGNRKLKGICKTKDDAANLYDDSLAKGGGGILMEQTDKEIFNMSIGNLSPKDSCTVTIEYITTLTTVNALDIENTKMLPTTLKLALPITRSTIKADKEKSLLQGLDINAKISMPDAISDLVVKNYKKANINIANNTAQVSYSNLTDSAGHDFTILIQMTEPYSPKTTLEIMNNKYASLQLSLAPKFNSENEILCDMIFLVDRSGSMSGKNIEEAKNALQIFIRSLPEGSLFNIVSFGSNFSFLFTSSRALDEETLNIATQHILGMSADMGGTNFLRPLQYIFGSQCDPKFPRQLFMLTDGDAQDSHEQILDLVKKSAGLVRVYTLGIGAGSDHKLLINMAKKGHGEAAFIDKDRVEKVVLQQFKKAMIPSLRNIKIDWKDWKEVFEQVPENITPVWNGSLLNVYGFTEKLQELNKVGDIKISASDGVTEFKTVVTLNGNNKVENNGVITFLAASAKISDMEAKNVDKKEIEQFALAFNLVSKYTSFVAVENREDSTENSMQKIEVNVTNKPKQGFFSNLVSKVTKSKPTLSSNTTFCGNADTCNIDMSFTSNLQDFSGFTYNSSGSSSQDFSGFTYNPHNSSGSSSTTSQASSEVDNFELLSVIGKGSFSKVMQTRDKVTGKIHSLTVYNKSSTDTVALTAKIAVLKTLSHPFLSSVSSSFESSTKYYIVGDYQNGGELFYHLQKYKTFEPLTAKFYAAQILLLCEYLLSKGVQNPPLVPELFHLTFEGYLAFIPLNTSEIDVNYISPEVYAGENFTEKSIVFVIGVFIYEMMVGLPPFYHQVTGIDYTKELKFPPKMDEETVQFLKGSLEIDPSKRIDMATFKTHSWWNGINWNDILAKTVSAPFIPQTKTAYDASFVDSEFLQAPVDDVSAVPNDMFAGFTFTSDSTTGTTSTTGVTYAAHPTANSPKISTINLKPFDKLILLQKVSGAFELTQDLADIVKKDLVSLQKSCPEPGQETPWATAIAINQLETTFKDRLDESQFIVSKAKKFLTKQNKQDMLKHIK